MNRFKDAYLHECVPGYPVYCSPRWSTKIAMVDSGSEQIAQQWEHPLNRYVLPEAVRDMTIFQSVRDHWLVMRGPAFTWPFRDPLDFASRPLDRPNEQPVVTDEDQIIGTGDGVTNKYQLIKTYTVGGESYTRTIYLPVVSSVVVKLHYNELDPPPPGWTVDRETGIITFDFAPVGGRLITAGFLFDVPVRFENDQSFDGITSSFSLGGFSDVTLLEVRPC